MFQALSKLPLAVVEVLFQESVHGFGLLEHEDGGFEVSGLEAAEFLQRAVEGALGGGAGAVDRGLEAVEVLVTEVFRRGDFQIGAAAKTPCGVDDFAGEGLFKRCYRREFGHVAGLEAFKDVLFFGTHEIRDGEETEFDGVL